MKKCSSPRQAWMLTIAAALDLFAFVLMASAPPHLTLLMIFGICEVVLILCAVAAWLQVIEHRMEQLSRAPDAPADSSAKT